jgi:hypothetical protein
MTHVVYIIANHETRQAYVGLTKQFGARIARHRRKKSHLFSGRHTVFKTEPMSAAAAQRKEADAISYLRLVGFCTVNVAKTGSLGQPVGLIWTKQRCAEEALKYTNRSDFQRAGAGAYDAAYRNRWLNDICSHMVRQCNPNGYWTRERCAEEAAKYSTRSDFARNARSAYYAALRKGFLRSVCAHMSLAQTPANFWTKKRCAEEALKFRTRSEFNKKAKGCYSAAYRNRWLNDICKHMGYQAR